MKQLPGVVRPEGDEEDSGRIQKARRSGIYPQWQFVSCVGFLTEPVNADDPEDDWYVVEVRGVIVRREDKLLILDAGEHMPAVLNGYVWRINKKSVR